MNSSTSTASLSHRRPIRAQFSPVFPRLSNSPRTRVADLGAAERAFVSRWLQPAVLDRIQPLLTRYHE